MRRLAADEFRDVIGRFASGVTVVTAAYDGRLYGTTANAVTSLSLDPPMILVSLSKQSETGRVIASCGHFAVNILGEGDAELAVRFAQKGGEKFDGVRVSESGCGAPLLEDALASLECRVVESVPVATHTVFLAEVEQASAREGTPLAYFRGRYGRLELPHVRPLSADSAAGALRARSAIESGAAALSVGSVTAKDMAGLRRIAAAGSAGTTLRDWLGMEREFGEELVALAGSPELLDAHRRIDAEVRFDELRDAAEADGADLPGRTAYRALVDAYDAGDLTAAIAAIERRADEVARTARDVIGAAAATS